MCGEAWLNTGNPFCDKIDSTKAIECYDINLILGVPSNGNEESKEHKEQRYFGSFSN